jgi:hypothetical protein
MTTDVERYVSRFELEARAIEARVVVLDRWLYATEDLVDDAERHDREEEARALRQTAALVRSSRNDLMSLARELDFRDHDYREARNGED